MRLWSLHPQYLDPQGLVALWREALLAQAVLSGKTSGYRNHPQLDRFKRAAAPLDAISVYLEAVHAEASVRGYSFDKAKILPASHPTKLSVATGQLSYEWDHLLSKLKVRSPVLYLKWSDAALPQTHPLFEVHEGAIEDWERRIVHSRFP